MLYSIDRMEIIRTVPHARTYRLWCSRMSKAEIKAIKDWLNAHISNSKKGVQTSSWIPGSDWTGTVFLPIWEKACLKNVSEAAKCFGLILWEVMMERPEAWSFGRYKLNEVPIEGMTYFRIELPDNQGQP